MNRFLKSPRDTFSLVMLTCEFEIYEFSKLNCKEEYRIASVSRLKISESRLYHWSACNYKILNSDCKSTDEV